MANVKLAPPWVTYVSELEQMFKYDPEVHVVYDNDKHEVKVYVDNPVKAYALNVLLSAEKEFGNVTLHIIVVPSNGYTETRDVLYEAALSGNGAFAFVKRISGIFANDLVYVVFKNRVVQYFNDDLGDVYGQCSTLYQEIAKHIFENKEGVFFCTDIDEIVKEDMLGVGEPESYWP